MVGRDGALYSRSQGTVDPRAAHSRRDGRSVGIRFRFKGSPRHPEPIAFIGLSHNNLDALKRGRPIRTGPNDNKLGLAVEVVIYAGGTEVEMTQELEDHEFVPKGSADKTAKALKARREFRLETAQDGERLAEESAEFKGLFGEG
jgi:hypothetical protein